MRHYLDLDVEGKEIDDLIEFYNKPKKETMTPQIAHQVIKNYLKTHSLPTKDVDVWVGETKYTWINLLKLAYGVK